MTADTLLLDKYAQKRDVEAFNELVKRHARLVYGVALRITGNAHDAEDIAQTCFVELAQKAGTIKSSLSGWLYQVAHSFALNMLRSKRSRSEREQKAAESIPQTVGETAWNSIHARIDEAIVRLPEEQRLPLIMHCLQGYTQEETAAALNISQSSVARRLESAISGIRQTLRESGVDIKYSAVAAGLLTLASQPVPQSLSIVLGKIAVAGLGPESFTAASSALSSKGIGLMAALKTGVAAIAVLTVAGATAVIVSKAKSRQPQMKAPVAAVTQAPLKNGALLGAPDFKPSPERPVGWRGDGSGRYPGAVPPLKWGRQAISTFSNAVCAARKPAGETKSKSPALVRGEGAGMAHYSIAEWLVAVKDCPDPSRTACDQDVAPKEQDLQPEGPGSSGGLEWKESKGPRIDLEKLSGSRAPGKAAFAHSYFYCPEDVKKFGVITHGQHHVFHCRIWIDGKVYESWPAMNSGMPLSKGWHRIMVKIASPPADQKEWTLAATLFQFGDSVEYSAYGVAWICRMPSSSLGMPIIVGSRIFALSDPNDIVCVDKSSGKILWIRPNPLYDAAIQMKDPSEKTRAALETLKPKREKLDALTAACLANRAAPEAGERHKLAGELTEHIRGTDPARFTQTGEWGGGNAVCTPTSDGKLLYVWFGETGMLCCYDFDGNRKWLVNVHTRWGGGHSVNSSPALIGDKIMMLIPHALFAFDKATGRFLWEKPTTLWAHPTLVTGKNNGKTVVVCPDGEIFRVEDGEPLSAAICNPDSSVASAISIDKGRAFVVNGKGFYMLDIAGGLSGPDKTPRAVWGGTDNYGNPAVFGSPLYDNGLIYFLSSEYNSPGKGLYAVEADSGKLVYNKQLDLHPSISYSASGCGNMASLTLAGKHIYAMDNNGTTVVVESGREGRIVSVNTIQQIGVYAGSQEITISTPIFEGNRMYYRGLENLYCISEQRN